MKTSEIWILDFGSQYTQLITRKIRELNFFSVIYTVEDALILLREKKDKPIAIILSGGPQSVFEDKEDYSILFEDNSIPILGICYGMQLIGQYYGGKVERGLTGEYGKAEIHCEKQIDLFSGKRSVWMSHSDHLTNVPNDFETIFLSENNQIAGIKHNTLPILAYQFHPEVNHTQNGNDYLKYFLTEIAGLKEFNNLSTLKDLAFEYLNTFKEAKVLCAFSGGVDSLVAAVLSQPIFKDNLYCFFVDHGLLRPQDLNHINLLQRKTNLNIEIIDAKNYFYEKLGNISDPEEKRRVIGHSFIDIFESKVREFEEQKNIKFTHLLQGTLYPDVIESISPFKKKGKSVTIKSHHNVGGLPERMKLELIEPLRLLFKDEVRQIGKELNLEYEWVFRHPFPGPGIGVRVLGEITKERVLKVQLSDQILFEELKKHGLYDSTWQAFTVLLPVKTVGVKGDGRSYEEVIALRMVDSTDGMTASCSEMPYSFMRQVSRRITNEVKGITRVVYDITDKPPGTIEWE